MVNLLTCTILDDDTPIRERSRGTLDAIEVRKGGRVSLLCADGEVKSERFLIELRPLGVRESTVPEFVEGFLEERRGIDELRN